MRDSDRFILHLVHPRPVPWSSLMEPIARALEVPLVTYSHWFSALEACLHDTSLSEIEQMRSNPALRLLNFFRNADLSGEDKEPLGVARLATDQAVQISATLNSGIKQLGGQDANNWVEAWRRHGFI